MPQAGARRGNPPILLGLPMMPNIDQVLCNIEVTPSFEPYNSSPGSSWRYRPQVTYEEMGRRGKLETCLFGPDVEDKRCDPYLRPNP